MRPAVGVRMPVMRLSSVVLPEPFGPKIPKISPGLMENETSDTAVSPPKRFVNSKTSSSTAPSLERTNHASRHDQDREDQHEAVQHGSGLAREINDMGKSSQ